MAGTPAIRIARFQIASDSRFGSRDFAHLSTPLRLQLRNGTYPGYRCRLEDFICLTFPAWLSLRALLLLPRASRTTEYRRKLLQTERVHLYARLRGFCHTDPTALAGNLEDPPPGMNLRHLSRKLTHSRDSAAINATIFCGRFP